MADLQNFCTPDIALFQLFQCLVRFFQRIGGHPWVKRYHRSQSQTFTHVIPGDVGDRRKRLFPPEVPVIVQSCQ